MFLSCFSGSDWLMVTSFGANTKWVSRGETEDKLRYRFSGQLYNWNLQHVISSLDVCGIALWQHKFSTDFTDRTLWSTICSKSGVFLQTHLRENKRKRFVVRIPSISPMFLCEQQEEERLKEAGTASTLYWLRGVTYHNLETYQNWICLIEKRFSRHV